MADNAMYAVPLAAQIAFMRKRVAFDRVRFSKYLQTNRMRPETAEAELHTMESIIHTLELMHLGSATQPPGQAVPDIPDQDVAAAAEDAPSSAHRTETFAEARARLGIETGEAPTPTSNLDASLGAPSRSLQP